MIRRIAKRLLPARLQDRIRRGLRAARTAVLAAFARTRWGATLYYALGSGTFRREQQAVLAGRVRYLRHEDSASSRIYLLRRNVHRLEKGLIMNPRRDVFATDYIRATVRAYRGLLEEETAGGAEPSPEICWAGDVLSSYFEVAGSHPEIDAARALYGTPVVADAALRRGPFLRDLAAPAPVDYDAMLALSRRRRSVRWFLQRPVPRDLVEKALAVAVQAPSACNRQPYEFRIFDRPELVRRVAGLAMGTRGFAENFPAVAVVVGFQGAYPTERDRHLIYIDGALAAMSFVFALETLGLSSCCINWPDIEEREAAMQETLGLGHHERPVMLIAFGYPDPEGMVPRSEKRDVGRAASYNRMPGDGEREGEG